MTSPSVTFTRGPPPCPQVFPSSLLCFSHVELCLCTLANAIFFSLWYPFQSLVYQSDISLPTVQNLDQVSPPCWHLFALYSFVLPHSCHSELVSLLFCSYNIYTYFLHHLQLCTFISLLIYFLILHWKHFQLRFPVSTVLPVSQHLAKGFAHRRHFLNVYWIGGWMDGRNESVFECGITITVVIVIK